MEYGNDRVFPLLWDFRLAPDESGMLVELQRMTGFMIKLRRNNETLLAVALTGFTWSSVGLVEVGLRIEITRSLGGCSQEQ